MAAGAVAIVVLAAFAVVFLLNRGHHAIVVAPHGSGILFVQHRTADRANIYVTTPDGTDVKALTDDEALDGSPTWSPDRRRIAFQSDRSGTDQVYVMDFGGSNVRRLTTDGTNTSPAWSPKGDLIVYVHQSGTAIALFVMATDGSGARQVAPLATATAGPTWSPDGSKVAFSSGEGADSRIYVVSAQGGESQRLTHGTSRDRQPTWSPDGKEIVFARVIQNGPSHIYVIEPAGGSARPLTSGSEDDIDPAWSPDGREIAFVRDDGSVTTMWLMNADGTGARALDLAVASVTGPNWG